MLLGGVIMSLVLIRPKVLRDESLGSYIYRICDANLCKLAWICEPLKVPKKFVHGALNLGSNKEVISIISGRTGFTNDELLNMTIQRFKSKIKIQEYEDFGIDYNLRSFCPLCIKEKPYHRIYWQHDLIKICLTHNTILVDRCLCGRSIGISEIFYNKCVCGVILSDIEPSYNSNDLIYFSQLRVYKALDINIENIKSYSDNEMYLNYKKEIFMVLYCMLNYIINEEIEKNSLEVFNKIFSIELSKSLQLATIQLIEEMLKEWPLNFYKFLDYKNSEEIGLITKKELKKGEGFSFFKCIDYFTRGYYGGLLSDILISYLLSRYENFTKLLFEIDDEKNNEHFLIEYIVVENFKLPYKDKLTFLKKIEIQDCASITCIEINSVISFFYKFFKKATVLDTHLNKNYIELIELYNLFSRFLYRLDEIVEIIFNNDLEIKLYLNEVGLNMIFIEKDRAIKCILHSLLNSYDEKIKQLDFTDKWKMPVSDYLL